MIGGSLQSDLSEDVSTLKQGVMSGHGKVHIKEPSPVVLLVFLSNYRTLRQVVMRMCLNKPHPLPHPLLQLWPTPAHVLRTLSMIRKLSLCNGVICCNSSLQLPPHPVESAKWDTIQYVVLSMWVMCNGLLPEYVGHVQWAITWLMLVCGSCVRELLVGIMLVCGSCVCGSCVCGLLMLVYGSCGLTPSISLWVTSVICREGYMLHYFSWRHFLHQ